MVTDINMSGVWMFMQMALRIVLGPPSRRLIDMHQRNGNYDLRVIRVRADLANTIQLFLFANDNIVNDNLNALTFAVNDDDRNKST